jgi:polyhydroxybutyrate depolymerase
MKMLAAVLASSGLLYSSIVIADTTESVTVAGIERSFELHIPARMQPRPAFVIALHPRPANGPAMRYITGFNAISDAHGFLVAYPNAVQSQWNGLTCCGKADDVSFLLALIEKTRAQHDIDPDRIYLVGVSNGGELAYRAVGEAPDTFAAVAVVAGRRVGPHAETGEPVRSVVPSAPVSLITMLGAKDQAAADQWAGLEDWRKINGCGPVRIETPLPASRVEAARCRNGSDVVAYLFNDVGHVWPGSVNSGPLSWPDAPLNAAQTIWRFFQDHPRQK